MGELEEVAGAARRFLPLSAQDIEVLRRAGAPKNPEVARRVADRVRATVLADLAAEERLLAEVERPAGGSEAGPHEVLAQVQAWPPAHRARVADAVLTRAAQRAGALGEQADRAARALRHDHARVTELLSGLLAATSPDTRSVLERLLAGLPDPAEFTPDPRPGTSGPTTSAATAASVRPETRPETRSAGGSGGAPGSPPGPAEHAPPEPPRATDSVPEHPADPGGLAGAVQVSWLPDGSLAVAASAPSPTAPGGREQVGTLVVDGTGRLVHLLVSPQWRRAGAASAMLDAAYAARGTLVLPEQPTQEPLGAFLAAYRLRHPDRAGQRAPLTGGTAAAGGPAAADGQVLHARS